MGYNELNIPKEHLQYTGHTSWCKIGAPATGVNKGGATEVDASALTATNNYYFQVTNSQTKIRVQVKSGHTAEQAKTDKLAKANIIAVIGIISIIFIFACFLQ